MVTPSNPAQPIHPIPPLEDGDRLFANAYD